MRDKLIENNNEITNQDDLLLESVNMLHEVNLTMGESNKMIKDQTQKLQKGKQTNKDIQSGYQRTHRILKRIKWKQILYKFVLFLLILLLGVTDVVLVFLKIK